MVASFADRVVAGVRDLFPGYFALVMATGIVSISAHLLGMDRVASALFALNVAAFVALWALTAARLVAFFPRLREDLTSHAKGPGFFTWVAGIGVLGSQFVLQRGDFVTASILWVWGAVLWFIIMYAFFTAVTVRREKPSLQEGVNGAWLIATVATQSVSVLGTLIAARFAAAQQVMLFFTLVMYLIGCMLYLSIITLIFYRLTFLEMSSAALTPPYWINMGAVAITTLAGATLIQAADRWILLQELLPFLKGFSLFFWAAGSWWIPALLILGVWRHLHKHFPLRYDPQYWGMVFPLGMYTASTYQLARALQVEFLLVIPHYFVYVALLAWLATFVGLLRRLVTSMLVPSPVMEASQE